MSVSVSPFKNLLPSAKVFAKVETQSQNFLQESKQILKSLPQEVQEEAKNNVFLSIMRTAMVKTSCSISLEKKVNLLKSLSGYSEQELKGIIQAETPGKLSEALKAFMTKLETDMPEVYTEWLGFPKIGPEFEKKGFAAQRKHILSSMKNQCNDKEYLTLINAKNEPELSEAFQNITERLQRTKIKQGVPLEVEQAMYNFQMKRNDTFLEIYKALKTEPTNSRVKEIEDILRTKYGMKFVDLADNEEKAEQILKAVELNATNGRKIPDNIIISGLIQEPGETILHTNLENTVILEKMSEQDVFAVMMEYYAERCTNPQLKDFYNRMSGVTDIFSKKYLSTEHPLHTVIHEFNHLGQNHLLATRFGKIPKEYKSTYENLSDYAKEGVLGEIDAELKTKQQLAKLTADEERLLEYLS